MLRPRLVAALFPAAVVLGSCTWQSDEGGAGAEPSPSTSTSSSVSGTARVDLGEVPVARGPLCDLVPRTEVEQALEGPLGVTAHYGNGEEAELSPGLVDVAHEWGCVFEGRDETVARAWVFARPVDRAEADLLVRRARGGEECAFPDPLEFGSPGLMSVCEVVDGGGPAPGGLVRARLEGLFGDTWVGCEVQEPLAPAASGAGDIDRADVVRRTVDWCTAVVTAAGASAD